MPLARIPAATATQNLRSRHSLWPDGRVSTDRLDGAVKVVLNGSFTFSRSDRIMTVGSCFAREIEKRLHQYDFDLPMLKLALPSEERDSTSPNDFANKYTIQSIVNELAWAFGDVAPPPPETLFLEVGEGLWHDPHLIHNMAPAPLERLVERRAMVQAAFAQLPSCRVVIVTLGLAEAWFDHRTGLHLNGAPPTAAIRRDPDRFSLDVLSYEEITEALDALRWQLRTHGHPDVKLLITVSPVPFKATFTGLDAIQANTYSKAVQRAAVEAFVRRYDGVDYFPSYEIVTLSARALAFEQDNIHVTPALVGAIMDRVLSHYVPEMVIQSGSVAAQTPSMLKLAKAPKQTKAALQREAKFLAAERRYPEACEAYDKLLKQFGDRMAAEERGNHHLDYGVALLRSDRIVDGVCHLRRALALMPTSDRAAFKLGLGLGRLKQVEASIVALRRATELSPGTAHYFSRLALAHSFNGEEAEALAHYRHALTLDPGNPEAKNAVSKALVTA